LNLHVEQTTIEVPPFEARNIDITYNPEAWGAAQQHPKSAFPILYRVVVRIGT